MAQYDVAITGSPPNFSVSVPSGPYESPVSVKFTYTSGNSSDQCKVWYQLQGAAQVETQTLNEGGNFTVNYGCSFNVTTASSTTEPPLSHVIHQGNKRRHEHS